MYTLTDSQVIGTTYGFQTVEDFFVIIQYSSTNAYRTINRYKHAIIPPHDQSQFCNNITSSPSKYMLHFTCKLLTCSQE
jgi:hypothetical protein